MRARCIAFLPQRMRARGAEATFLLSLALCGANLGPMPGELRRLTPSATPLPVSLPARRSLVLRLLFGFDAPEGNPETDQPADCDHQQRHRLQFRNVAEKEPEAVVVGEGQETPFGVEAQRDGGQ